MGQIPTFFGLRPHAQVTEVVISPPRVIVSRATFDLSDHYRGFSFYVQSRRLHMYILLRGECEKRRSLLVFSSNNGYQISAPIPCPRCTSRCLRIPFSLLLSFFRALLDLIKCFWSTLDQNQVFSRLVRECNGSKINSFWRYIQPPAVLTLLTVHGPAGLM